MQPHKMAPPSSLPFHAEDLESTITQRFAAVVRRFPDQVAIKTREQQLTYREVDAISNHTAQAIVTRRGGGAEPVALLCDHEPTGVIALLAVLKAGKGYVALDPAHPRAKLAEILENGQIQLILTTRPHAPLASELASHPDAVITLDSLDTRHSDMTPAIPMSAETIAAIFYTSGSTGAPKGVVWTHRNVLHLAGEYITKYGIGPDDRHAWVFSYGFAVSVTSLFSTLLSGATLYPYPLRATGIHQVLTWLQAENITIFRPPIMYFRRMFDESHGSQRLPHLRLLVLGGESVYTSDVERFKQICGPDSLLLHHLGATEVGVFAEYGVRHDAPLEGHRLPVGYATKDKEIFILDNTGQPCGFNTIGEIAVRSRYLSPGYWRDPELTRQKFLPDPEGSDKRIYLTGDLGRMRADGCLEYLGRKDFQVKIRGYRVELAEVEAALYALEGVKEAVVVAKEEQAGGKSLVAYVVPARQPAPTVSDLRRAMILTLPEYMIPSCFIYLDAFPLTPSGKVDRQVLPEPDQSRPELATELVTPRDDIESHLVQIFETTLHVQPIGVQDNFFELGGDSLSYLRLFTEIERQFGHTLAMEDVARNPTIEHLAAMLQQQESVPLRSFEPPPPISHNPFTLIREVFKTPQRSWAEKFRHTRHILLHQLRHVGPDFDDFIVPYAVGARFLAWFCTRRWVHTMFFQRQKQLIRQCLTCISGANNEADVMRHSLLCNFWSQWRIAALENSSSEEFARWAPVTGFATVQRAYEKGQGVILATSHLALVPLIESLLDRQGVEHAFIGGWQGARAHPYPLALMGLHRLQPSTGRARNLSREAWRHTQLSMGRQILQQGGIVRIGADGYQGQRSLTVPFYGRLRGFSAGFAELALSTGVDVIPVRVSLDDETGQVQIIFLEPLDAGAADMPHHTRVESLLRQYIQVLEDIWATDLGSIGWEHLEKFLALPPVPHIGPLPQPS